MPRTNTFVLITRHRSLHLLQTANMVTLSQPFLTQALTVLTLRFGDVDVANLHAVKNSDVSGLRASERYKGFVPVAVVQAL